MKTSEYIRECVDKFLAADASYRDGHTFLCCCFRNRRARLIGDDYSRSAILCLIRENLPRNSLILDVTYSHDGSVAQQERFMFAEFMALYFEDLGD